MGGDGGSFQTRVDLVKIKEKPKTADAQELADLAKIRWGTCAVSSEALNEPIVSDEFGNLYSKEQIIKRLLNKTLDTVAFCHIKSLKDLITIQLNINPTFINVPKETTIEDRPPRWICPITSLETNGKNRFIAIKTCGHVFSERALKEVPSQNCLLCNTPFTSEDLLLLVPTGQEFEEIKAKFEIRMNTEKEKIKEKRKKDKQKKEKQKKRKKRKKNLKKKRKAIKTLKKESMKVHKMEIREKV